MKNTILFTALFMFLIPQTLFCQAKKASTEKTKLTAIYLDIGVGVAKGTLSGGGLNFILSNNLGGSFSFNELVIEAKKLPNDYKPSSFLGYRIGNPEDKVQSYSLRFLKEFPTNNIKVRFGLEGGPSIVKYTAKEFVKSVSQPISLFILFGETSNYKSTTTTNNTIGASFRAKMEFPIGRWIGLELALNSNINQYHTYVGAEIHMTVGLVRAKNISKKI